MTCNPLAYTGSGINVGLLAILALAFLGVGGVVLLLTRRRGRATTGVLLLLISAAAVSMTSGTPGRALAQECPPLDNSLTITQTSVMDGLAPGIGPVPITGLVRNDGADSTYISAVQVKIVGVVTAAGSPEGSCDVSDFVLLDAVMPVGRTLPPQGATTFAGASIGMRSKSVNQDTCKAATIKLLYTANPGK